MNGTLLGGLAAVVSDLGLGGLGLVAAFGRFRRGSPPGRLGRQRWMPAATARPIARRLRVAPSGRLRRERKARRKKNPK